ncbi:polygalacturonase QRT3-like [Ziziphus jujuba]|uniref:Polygalacturonase QRT3-like n=1 Tax=Ziziphus jujuba TaxID=326968 RepID=A0ABM4A2R7_ZIZJJ|nr:polygalacturonase QRT3-like [Ziziphus jujuba]
MQAFKASLMRGSRGSVSHSSAAPHSQPQPPKAWRSSSPAARVYYMSDFGGDPTGVKDSTEHIQALLLAAAGQGPSPDAQGVMSGAGSGSSEGSLTAGVPNQAGTADFEGGTYKVSKPVQVPPGGNIVIKDGTIQASKDYEGGPVFDASLKQAPPAENTERLDDIEPAQLSPDPSSFSFEYITFQNIMIDSNHRGGGISLSNALRTSIENVYVAHFSTTGINVHPSSSETYISNSFLGQHPTAGRDPREGNFTGTAINLSGTNNAITDVVLFSSAVGVDVSGHGSTLSGVHCYNKATRFGGTGIYLRKPGLGLGRNRIINSYLDYTRILAEDPLQLHISNSFLRGDAFVALKSINGVVSGVNIVDNTFSGSNKGTGIVQLQQSNGPFNKINQVVVDRNSVRGMSMKATVANGAVQGNGTAFALDFNPVLLFPNRITHAQYSLIATNGAFPNHVLRSVSNNRVVVATNVPVSATVFATVDQN